MAALNADPARRFPANPFLNADPARRFPANPFLNADPARHFPANPFLRNVNARHIRARFCCKKCYRAFALDLDFIQVVPPIAIANTVPCLVKNIGNVTFGPVLRQIRGRLIGANPKTQVDIAHIHCISCQTFVGWRIVRQYTPHPIIREGQCILLFGIGGAVTSSNVRSSNKYK